MNRERDPSSNRPYEVAEPPPIPDLSGSVVVGETVEELVELMSSDLLAHALNCVRAFGDFHVALCGGETVIPFYRHLMLDPICRGIPWVRTHLWLVEEHCVPFDDDRSHWKMIESHFNPHSGIPISQQHPIPALSATVEEDYALALRRGLEWREPGHDRIDYMLLDLGDDGRIAGLLPHSPALKESRRFVRLNDGPAVSPPPRVTMTLPIINSARLIAVMATGESRRRIIQRLADHIAGPPTPLKERGEGTTSRLAMRLGDPDPGLPGEDARPARRQSPADADALPILGVRPLGGVLTWYLDRAACPEG